MTTAGLVRELGRSDGPAWVSAHAGAAAWSERRERTGRYVLKLLVGGRVVTARVAAQPRPFDVDLGPDRAGRLTAVYSRCRSAPDTVAGEINPARGRGCRLFAYSVGARRERRLGIGQRGLSAANPTLWRGRVAFAARDSSGSVRAYVASLPTGRARLVRVEEGARRQAVAYGLPQRSGNGVSDLDLRGARLGAIVSYEVVGCSEEDPGFGGVVSHVVVQDLARERRTTPVRSCDGAPLRDAQYDARGHLWFLNPFGGQRQLNVLSGSERRSTLPLDVVHGVPLAAGRAVVTYTRQRPPGAQYVPTGIGVIAVDPQPAG